jgi:hypothetical protein
MGPEVAMVHHQEATTAHEEASVAALHLPDGMVEDAAAMAPLDRDLEDHHHPGMLQTRTTDLKVVWHLLNDSDHLKTNSWPGGLRSAVILVLVKRLKWMSVLAARLMRYPIKCRLTV